MLIRTAATLASLTLLLFCLGCQKESEAIVSIALGALSPGKWSLDDAFGIEFPFDPKQALAVAAIVGIGGAAAFLAIFWRPPKKTAGSGS